MKNKTDSIAAHGSLLDDEYLSSLINAFQPNIEREDGRDAQGVYLNDQHVASQIPNRKSKIQNPKFQIPIQIANPKSKISNGKSQIQNPKSKILLQIPDPRSKIKNPKSQIPFQIPDPRSKIQNPKSKIQNLASSFTLIELMVVMAIMAILAALLFPAVMGAKDRARKKQAMVELCDIVIASKKFAVEHGRWPNQNSDSSDRTYFSDNHLFINTLRIPASNDRNRIYLPLQEASLDTNANYVDPWGWPYIICVDENGDGNLTVLIENAAYTNCFTGSIITNYNLSKTNLSRDGVMAASIGSDQFIASWTQMQ
jgi:prepilin-type N-terminal cleavage/methylation domain-containing protein